MKEDFKNVLKWQTTKIIWEVILDESVKEAFIHDFDEPSKKPTANAQQVSIHPWREIV